MKLKSRTTESGQSSGMDFEISGVGFTNDINGHLVAGTRGMLD
jgi:hypothetical protein